MVTQIGIHKHDVFILASLQAIDVSRTETHLSRSGVQDNFIFAVDGLELLNSSLGVVRRVIVDDHDLHFDLPVAGIEQVRR